MRRGGRPSTAALLLLIVSALLQAAPQVEAAGGRGLREVRRELITDGGSSAEGRYPYIVALMRVAASGDITFACTGTLIAPTIVISPAHCYFDETPEVQTLVPQYYKNATAQIGRLSNPNLPANAAPANDTFDSIKVIDTVIDPRYNNFDGTNTDYDMAVHRLASPSTKTPAKLNLDMNGLGEAPGARLTSIGWGYDIPVPDSSGGMIGFGGGTPSTPPSVPPSSSAGAPITLGGGVTAGSAQGPSMGTGAPLDEQNAVAALVNNGLPVGLQQATFVVQPLDKCRSITQEYNPLPPALTITSRMICGIPSIGIAPDGTATDTCSGDSGGPLLMAGPTPGAPDVVYGFTSWGITPPGSGVTCGAPGDLNFFVNVAAFSDFLAPYLPPPAAPAAEPAPKAAGH